MQGRQTTFICYAAISRQIILYKYLNDNNLLSQEQSGFRALHSTVSAYWRALMIGILRLIIVKWLELRLSILESHLILYISHFFVESLRGMGSEMMNCVDLCLNLQVKSNFVASMGQTPRLMQLTLEYLKAHVLVLSFSLSISMIFLKS